MFLKHKPRGFLEAVLAGTMIRKLSATSRAGTIREHNNQGKTVQHAECESGSFCCTLEHGKNKERDRDPQNWVGALPAKIFLIKPMYFNALKSGEAMCLYHQMARLASQFISVASKKPELPGCNLCR